MRLHAAIPKTNLIPTEYDSHFHTHHQPLIHPYAFPALHSPSVPDLNLHISLYSVSLALRKLRCELYYLILLASIFLLQYSEIGLTSIFNSKHIPHLCNC
jgi:hypothetical protein